MQFLFLRLLSGIPSPVLVGAMIDATCTLWNTKCNVNQNCLNYDYSKLGRIIVTMGAPSQFLSLIFFGLSWHCSKDSTDSTTIAGKAGIENKGADLNDNLELNKLNDRRPRSESIVTSF
ncbi:solute carrier organic anion transporter family member 5A1 [Exaiptasia diaphana]|uniref:Uncharacterized protein n=1 Tax=Exaiptasia diaphana TaxID=2652724 RepID=A0A913XCI0_EXADI|nr:solute carrier organic anion transporter family member 5A1 [Exaiptasia diaphana]